MTSSEACPGLPSAPVGGITEPNDQPWRTNAKAQTSRGLGSPAVASCEAAGYQEQSLNVAGNRREGIRPEFSSIGPGRSEQIKNTQLGWSQTGFQTRISLWRNMRGATGPGETKAIYASRCVRSLEIKAGARMQGTETPLRRVSLFWLGAEGSPGQPPAVSSFGVGLSRLEHCTPGHAFLGSLYLVGGPSL